MTVRVTNYNFKSGCWTKPLSIIRSRFRIVGHFRFNNVEDNNKGYRILKLTVSCLSSVLILSGCTPTPPDHREPVTAPVYEGGDIKKGEVLYEEYCVECHKLQPGQNKKGPQLIGVYNAPSASLSDYKYTSDMSGAHLTWDADTLERYIADPIAMLPDTRMLTDPIPEKQIRQDIIAYLSTLGRADSEAPSTEGN